jgi:hypothetical protein
MSSLDLVENLLVPLIMFGVYILLAVAVGLSARKRGRRLAMDLAYVSIQSVIHGVNQDFLFSICKSPILHPGHPQSTTISRWRGQRATLQQVGRRGDAADRQLERKRYLTPFPAAQSQTGN